MYSIENDNFFKSKLKGVIVDGIKLDEVNIMTWDGKHPLIFPTDLPESAKNKISEFFYEVYPK